MLTLLFIVLMFAVIGKMVHLAIKLAWGMTKVVFAIVFLPIILIGLALAGLMYVSIILLVLVGIVAFIGGLVFG